MTHFITLVVVLLSGIVLSILAMPRPDGFDDEGEMSVPRSPKIQGPANVNLPYTRLEDVTNLQCLIEGSPTPTVIWSKDGQEIRGGSDLYNMTYDATDGKAELRFLESAKHEKKFMTGNFSCIAANFLGRAQKIFAIEVAEQQVSTINNATTEIPSSINTTSESDQHSIMTEISTNDTILNLSSTVYTTPIASTVKVANSTSVGPGSEPSTRKLTSTTVDTMTSKNGTDLEKN